MFPVATMTAARRRPSSTARRCRPTSSTPACCAGLFLPDRSHSYDPSPLRPSPRPIGADAEKIIGGVDLFPVTMEFTGSSFKGRHLQRRPTSVAPTAPARAEPRVRRPLNCGRGAPRSVCQAAPRLSCAGCRRAPRVSALVAAGASCQDCRCQSPPPKRGRYLPGLHRKWRRQ